MSAVRYDIGSLRPARKMSDGRLRADAYYARAGVQRYEMPDGTIRRELRPPEEVFHPDSLASFEQVPVTDGHPPVGLLDGESAPRYMRGSTGESVTRDDELVRGSVMVADKALVEKMSSGAAVQTSAGYTCDVDATPGVHPTYGAYDAVQRNIRANHLAIVPAGRAGSAVRVRMDGAGIMIADVDLSAAARHRLEPEMFADPAHEGLPLEDEDHVRAAMSRFGQEKFSSPDARRSGYHRVVARAKALGIDPAGFVAKWSPRLDAISDKGGLPNANQGVIISRMPDPALNPNPEEALRALNQRVTELEAENVRLDAEAKKQTDRAIAAEAVRDALKGKSDELEVARLDERAALEADAVKRAVERADGLQKIIDGNQAKFDGAVRERALLLARAAAVLGYNAPIFDKSDRQVRVEVIKRLDSRQDVTDTREDAALNAVFEMLYTDWVAGAQSRARASETLAGAPVRRVDSPAANTAPAFVSRRDEWMYPLPSTKLRQ